MPLPFIAAAHKNPTDTVTPLVLADWLEEQGETKKAHAIRFAIEHQHDPEDSESPEEAMARVTAEHVAELKGQQRFAEAARVERGEYKGDPKGYASAMKRIATDLHTGWLNEHEAKRMALPWVSKDKDIERRYPHAAPLLTEKIASSGTPGVYLHPLGVELHGADSAMRIKMPDARVTEWAREDSERSHGLIRAHQSFFNPAIPEGEGRLTIHASPKAAAAHAETYGHLLVHPHITWSPEDSQEHIAAVLEAAHKGDRGALGALNNSVLQRALRETGGEVKLMKSAGKAHEYASSPVPAIQAMGKRWINRTDEAPQVTAGRLHVTVRDPKSQRYLMASVPAKQEEIDRIAAHHPNEEVRKRAQGQTPAEAKGKPKIIGSTGAL